MTREMVTKTTIPQSRLKPRACLPHRRHRPQCICHRQWDLHHQSRHEDRGLSNQWHQMNLMQKQHRPLQGRKLEAKPQPQRVQKRAHRQSKARSQSCQSTRKHQRRQMLGRKKKSQRRTKRKTGKTGRIEKGQDLKAPAAIRALRVHEIPMVQDEMIRSMWDQLFNRCGANMENKAFGVRL